MPRRCTREVVKEALARNAAAVILVHNHPSGVAEPSETDERITMRLKAALSLVGVKVVDHMAVGESIASFVEPGLL
jgi:DNA repair protein RadC